MLRQADPGKEVVRINLPGCLLKFACCFVDEPDTKAILRKVNSVYVWATENSDYAAETDVPADVAKKLLKRNFSEMMTANSEGEEVYILFRERGKMKEYVIAVNGSDDAVIYLKGRLSLSDLENHSDFLKGKI